MVEEGKKRAVGTHTSENEIKFLCVAEAVSHPRAPALSVAFANFFIHRHRLIPLRYLSLLMFHFSAHSHLMFVI